MNRKKKKLDSLQKRKNIVQSLEQRRRRSPQRSDESSCRQKSSSFANSSSNLSNEIIEDSETENRPRTKFKKPNMTINTSSDGDLNTSTISVPLSNKSFFGNDMGNLIPPVSPSKEQKVRILSSVIIKPAERSSPNTPTNSSDVFQLPNTSTPVHTTKLNTLDCGSSQHQLSTIVVQKTSPSILPTSSSDSISLLKDDCNLDMTTENLSTKPNVQAILTPLENSIETIDLVKPTSSIIHGLEPPSVVENICMLQNEVSEAQYTPVASYSKVSLPEALPSTSSPLPCRLPVSNPDACSVLNNEATTSSLSSKRKKRKTTLNKKIYADFLSDEEALDFSAGSSEEWSLNESETSGSPQKKKKKLSKKKKKPEEDINLRKKRKRINKRKSNKKLKDEGKAYETEKGNQVEEKKMKDNPCKEDKCKRECYNISEARRESLFKFFWSLDNRRRRDWIINCSRTVNIARKRTDSPVSRRNKTYEYFINNGEDRQKVCQKFLLETLDITQKYLLYTLSHSKENMAQDDLRKRQCPDKYSPEAKENAKFFIEKLPAVPSHYNRKRTNRVYLPQELKNISNVFRLYQKDCEESGKEAVGESVFRNIFNTEYNMSFHVPKKDKCLICTKADRNDVMNEVETQNLEEHREEKSASYQRFLVHQKYKSLNNDTVTTSFDLQKVLTTPHGDTMLLGFARKYAVYNLTLYESGTQDGFCYVWGECDAKRGSQEIATCLYKYFQDIDKRKIKNLILYCDACPGQNKNKTVLSVINYFLKVSKNVEVIQINYLLPGHTYMPVDSVHATIEREVQKIVVWSPSQWMTYISAARKRPRPYNVILMEHNDFIKWEELSSKTFTKQTLRKIQFKNIRVATFKKKYTDQVEIKYSMKINTPATKINLCEKEEKGKGKGKGKGRGKGKAKGKTTANECTLEQIEESTLPELKYNNIRYPISGEKYNDLKAMCESGLIPKVFQKEYLNLPNNSSVKDTLPQTDEEDEVIEEEE